MLARSAGRQLAADLRKLSIRRNASQPLILSCFARRSGANIRNRAFLKPVLMRTYATAGRPKAPKKKPAKKAKKAPTLEQARRLKIKELKSKALIKDEPKQSIRGYSVFSAEQTKGVKGVQQALSGVAQKWRSLSASEKQGYTDRAAEEAAIRKQQHQAWVNKHSVAEISTANRARSSLNSLRRKLEAEGLSKPRLVNYNSIKDERQAKRPTPAFAFFVSQHYHQNEFEGLGAGDRAKELSKRWKSLDASQRKSRLTSSHLPEYSKRDLAGSRRRGHYSILECEEGKEATSAGTVKARSCTWMRELSSPCSTPDHQPSQVWVLVHTIRRRCPLAALGRRRHKGQQGGKDWRRRPRQQALARVDLSRRNYTRVGECGVAASCRTTKDATIVAIPNQRTSPRFQCERDGQQLACHARGAPAQTRGLAEAGWGARPWDSGRDAQTGAMLARTSARRVKSALLGRFDNGRAVRVTRRPGTVEQTALFQQHEQYQTVQRARWRPTGPATGQFPGPRRLIAARYSASASIPDAARAPLEALAPGARSPRTALFLSRSHVCPSSFHGSSPTAHHPLCPCPRRSGVETPALGRRAIDLSESSMSETAPAAPVYSVPNVVTDDDHGAWVTVVAAILMSWMVLTLLMRVVIRTRFNGPWGADDTVASVGSAVALAMTIAIFIAVNQGFGRKTSLLSQDEQSHISKSLYAGQILYITAMCLSKISTALLIARLTRVRRHVLATQAVSAFTAAWGIATILAVSLRCDLSAPWSYSGGAQCVSPFTRWLGVEIVSMFIELLLFGLAIFLVWGLQMSRKLKLIVVGAFMCRPLVIVTLGVRIYYLRPVYFSSDPFFNGVEASILTQVCMHYALMAATIPCTKPFIKAFHSGYMDPEGYTAGSHSNTKQQNSGFMNSANRDTEAQRGGRTDTLATASGSQFNTAKNPSYSQTNYPTSTHPLTSSDSRSTNDPNQTASDPKKSSDSIGAVPAHYNYPTPVSHRPSQENFRAGRVAPPVSSLRPKHQPSADGDDSPSALFRPDAGVVRTTIEHDPYRRDGTREGVERRRNGGPGGQEDAAGTNGGGLTIRQTREYEVSYEPA
ncbi:hypothetical protein FH972_021985 [Carpinus fangiana]|uniref:HMG box domain-containing protein n=1 Tax=Carpinus fangiana TaxID=176857 RepID=A0A5N6KRH4_9ROSI|nr:hypothetical protein FH972_021985 [Carpinus fangiana]